MPIRILLGDMSHDYRPNHISIPLGIGFIAEYLRSLFDANLSIHLYKSPEKIIAAIREEAPDFVGLSNYSWNLEINRLIIRRIKKESPATVVFSGGPHIRTDREGIAEHLRENPDIDYYIMFEGEISTGNLMARALKKTADENPLKPHELAGEEIPGIAYLYEDQLVYQSRATDKNELEKLPSPILSGILDEFLSDPLFLPMLETNRGCPFGCTFCAWGFAAQNKVRKFNLERVLKEITYVANISKAATWFYSDANFGMFARDIEIAQALRNTARKSQYLQRISINWAKNSSKYCTEIAHIMSDLCEPLVAVQSTDEVVLKNIKRGNIKLSTMSDLVEQGRQDGIGMTTDVLVGLSGETFQSHMNTLRDVFSTGFEFFNVGAIRMLPGSEMETDLQRSKWGIKTKYRFISGFFGIYDGEPICEYEESVVGSNTLSTDEMGTIRVIHFLAWALWNSGLAQPLLRFMYYQNNVNPLDGILTILNNSHDDVINTFINQFKSEAAEEWFDSREDTVKYFKENYKKLLTDEYLKLNLKYLAKIVLQPSLARKILTVIAQKCQSDNADQLIDFCMERIFFIDQRTHKKEIEVSPELLRDLSCIYPNIAADEGNVCKFSVTDKFYRVINTELERFNFNDNPLRAVTLMLHCYGDKLMYDFSFSDNSLHKGSIKYFDSFDYQNQLNTHSKPSLSN